MATKKSPSPTVRESIDTASIACAASPRISRPPVAATMSPAVSGSRSTSLRRPRAGPPPGERRARHLDVVERQHALADDLVFLVPLAGNQHEIARSRVANGALDRGLAIGDRQIR